MTITLHADPVPLRVDDSGAIRVGQSPITLDVLLQYWRLGMTPEEIARGLDSLTPANVHGSPGLLFPPRSRDRSNTCVGVRRKPKACSRDRSRQRRPPGSLEGSP